MKKTKKIAPVRSLPDIVQPLVIYLFVVMVLMVFAGKLTIRDDPRMVLQRAASDTLGVKVTIGTLDLDFERMIMTAADIKIANPPGFQRKNAVEIGHITAHLTDLSGNMTVFDTIEVSGVRLFLEVTPDGSNLMTIHDSSVPYASARLHSKAGQKSRQTRVKTVMLSDITVEPFVMLGDYEVQTARLDFLEKSDFPARGGILVSQAIAGTADYVIGQTLKTASEKGFLTGAQPEAFEDIALLVYGPPTVNDVLEVEQEKIIRQMRNMWRFR